jgi:hypothetical protein
VGDDLQVVRPHASCWRSICILVRSIALCQRKKRGPDGIPIGNSRLATDDVCRLCSLNEFVFSFKRGYHPLYRHGGEGLGTNGWQQA